MRSLKLGIAVLVSLMVSSPVRANAPPGRYTASSGAVIDNATHLTWQRVVATAGGDDGAGRETWANAQTYCANLGGGYRLPTVKELLTIVDFSQSNPAIDSSSGAFPNTPSEPFWTATPLSGSPPTNAWFVSFEDGYAGNVNLTEPNRVRCVR
ncbi:MAG TPA: DUF1566 domain-containing protein [Polyangiaceae bacterium]|jgi:hypothetical protein|nr:DUF1566 domain-containing protein [Polyangiaceae bacterium]